MQLGLPFLNEVSKLCLKTNAKIDNFSDVDAKVGNI